MANQSGMPGNAGCVEGHGRTQMALGGNRLWGYKTARVSQQRPPTMRAQFIIASFAAVAFAAESKAESDKPADKPAEKPADKAADKAGALGAKDKDAKDKDPKMGTISSPRNTTDASTSSGYAVPASLAMSAIVAFAASLSN